jgi:hypothetical protein
MVSVFQFSMLEMIRPGALPAFGGLGIEEQASSFHVYIL